MKSFDASLDASVQIQRHQIHQRRWNQRLKEKESNVENLCNTRVPCNIPSNPSLIMPVEIELNSYTTNQNGDSPILTESRIQLSNNIDLESEGRQIEPWERSFKELVSIVRKFGHARIPQRFPSNPSLRI